MSRSKARKQSKGSLKTVNKSLLPMEAKRLALVIFSLAKQYCSLSPEANESEIKKFLSIFQQEHLNKVDLFKLVAVDGSSGVNYVRNLLNHSITLFLSSIEPTLPEMFSALNSIDWRNLFGIEVASSAPVAVSPPSGQDSGDASMDSPSTEIKSNPQQ